MNQSNKPIANPDLVFREEFDDWAILFDPDSGKGVGLNPVSAFIWKRLDGKHSLEDIFQELRETFTDVPIEAESHLKEFVDNLYERGFVGYFVTER
jgi:SynChlorMet cassette protein ScmD